MTSPNFTLAMKAAMAATEPTAVPFGGNTYRVLPPMKWRQSAMEAIRAGRVNDWARMVMVNDLRADGDGKFTGSDDAAAFIGADLTNEEMLEFFRAYADAAGSSPGESPTSQR